MYRDCPHDRCRFFISVESASCPACGSAVAQRSQRHLIWVAMGCVVGLIVVLFAGGWFVAGLTGLVLAAVAATRVWASAWFTSRGPTNQSTTLDGRYQAAADDATYWLQKWSEFFRLNAQADSEPEEDLPADERLLLGEARAAADAAAHDAVMRRNSLGQRYVDNGFERLNHIDRATNDHQWLNAVAIIENYLETLWLDPGFLAEATRQLDARRNARRTHRRRSELATLASTVRVLVDPALIEPADQRAEPDQIDDERLRLRAERRLLRDSWDNYGV